MRAHMFEKYKYNKLNTTRKKVGKIIKKFLQHICERILSENVF